MVVLVCSVFFFCCFHLYLKHLCFLSKKNEKTKTNRWNIFFVHWLICYWYYVFVNVYCKKEISLSSYVCIEQMFVNFLCWKTPKRFLFFVFFHLQDHRCCTLNGSFDFWYGWNNILLIPVNIEHSTFIMYAKYVFFRYT